LLDLVPGDFGLCLSVRDLRGQHARLLESRWFAAFRASEAGQALFAAPELTRLARQEKELGKVFDVDWPTLRDDILGDELVLAHRPPPPGKADDEQGIVLLRARQPELMARLIQRLNELQRGSGELKSVDSVAYKGRTYHKRNDRGKELFYLLEGPLLAVTGKEAVMHSIIDQLQQPPAEGSLWRQRFRRAGADQAFVALGANPRLLDANLAAKSNEAAFLQALEAIFVVLQPGDEALELRLSVQATPEQLPSWLRAVLLEAPAAAHVWQYFPTEAVVALVGHTNFGEALTTVMEMTPPSKREQLAEAAQRSLGAITGLDFFKDILPNVGPDWGVCVLPARQPQDVPLVLAALAVQPGARTAAVDQALLRALQLVAGLAVLDYNKNHPDAMRQLTVLQDKVEVRYLQCERLFPPGLQPAYALKDGYLLLASAPDAILQFRRAAAPAAKDTPLLRISAHGLAALLRERREQIVARLTQQQRHTSAEAQQNLAKLTEFLDLFDRLELSRRAAAGQADWVLRVYPRK
jgi:hypothetical protein